MPRILALLLTALWIVAALWATDAQMRESDQASILTGALELARGETGWVGNGSYNYDKQYLSYWFVTGALKASGEAGSEGTIAGVVRTANVAAVLLFSFALVTAVAVRSEWWWVTVGVLASVLLSPVVAFTGVLLSSSLISGAFVLLLVVVLREHSCSKNSDNTNSHEDPRISTNGRDRDGTGYGGRLSPWGTALTLLLSFAAVAARQDAILLMPMLAVLVVRWGSWRLMLRQPVLWAMACGCLVAMVTGRLIDPTPTSLPSPFFDAPTFVVYLAGGLGGCLLALLVFSGRLLCVGTREALVLGCVALVPLAFYGCFLYTPRYFLPASMVLVATVLLPRGIGVWRLVVAARGGRVLLAAVLLAIVLPWIVGVRMTGWTKGCLVVANSALYPTADGFWPMGAYGSFFARLAGGGEDPIDHNQEVWAAWADLDGDQLPPGKGAIISSGLTSYGQFALAWHGRERTSDPSEADYILFDDRTITKRQLTVGSAAGPGQDQVGDLLTKGSVKVLGRAMGRSILLWTAGEGDGEIDEQVSLRVALSEGFGGNDFRMGPWGEGTLRSGTPARSESSRSGAASRAERGERGRAAGGTPQGRDGREGPSATGDGRGSPSATGEAEWMKRDWKGYRIVLAAREAESLGSVGTVEVSRSAYDEQPWYVVRVSGEELRRLAEEGLPDDGKIWIACGMMPEFMDVRRYGRGG